MHHTLSGRPTNISELLLADINLHAWTEDYSFIIIPNIYTSPDCFLKDPFSVKNNEDGLSLVAWWIAPELLKKYGFPKKTAEKKEKNSFQEFLRTQSKTKKIYSGYQFFNRSDSQEKIGELEIKNPESRYLASILDLTPDDLPLLENLKKTCLAHLKKSYGIKFEEDLIEIYIHFPYPDKHTTLHVHIRVNVGRHPMEKARSFSLDEIITCLKASKPIVQLILERTPYFTDDFDILHDIPGVTLKQVKNPYIISLPLKIEEDVILYSSSPKAEEKVEKKTTLIKNIDQDSVGMFSLLHKTTEKTSFYTSCAVL